MTTVGDIGTFLQTLAPAETAETWDNVGMLVGAPAQPVTRLLVCLDITRTVVEQAAAIGAQLIVSHHPVIFSPLRTLPTAHPVYALAAAGLAAIAAHTNLDKAPGGVNDALAAQLGLHDIQTAADGLCRIGTLEQPLLAESFAGYVAAALHTPVRVCNPDVTVHRVAVCGGSGGDYFAQLQAVCDAFVTGEVRHHEWLEAVQSGKAVVEAGHFATEVGVVPVLARRLAEAFPDCECYVAAEQPPYTTVG